MISTAKYKDGNGLIASAAVFYANLGTVSEDKMPIWGQCHIFVQVSLPGNSSRTNDKSRRLNRWLLILLCYFAVTASAGIQALAVFTLASFV